MTINNNQYLSQSVTENKLLLFTKNEIPTKRNFLTWIVLVRKFTKKCNEFFSDFFTLFGLYNFQKHTQIFGVLTTVLKRNSFANFLFCYKLQYYRTNLWSTIFRKFLKLSCSRKNLSSFVKYIFSAKLKAAISSE